MGLVDTFLVVVRSLVVPRGSLAVENLALRQQLAVLKRSVKRPRLRRRDRFLWAWLSRIWHAWRSAIIIVQPETVIRWRSVVAGQGPPAAARLPTSTERQG